MRVERGASQLLFGMLPQQTIDLEGRVWRVSQWTDPVKLALDQSSVRTALRDALAPWSARGNDDGIDNELRANATVEIVGVNHDRGAMVETFPRQWRCRACNRIHTERVLRCQCGATGIAQMQFVAYHTCGVLREPMIPRCPTHRAVAVRLPGTATARELYFYCPECNRRLSQGFPFQPCSCGDGGMNITVHRAGAVFSPQYAVVVNPPDLASAARLRAAGGGARALEWVLEGIDSLGPAEGQQTLEGFLDMLVQSGISADTARHLADQALERGEVTRGSGGGAIRLPPTVRERAQEEALSLTSAVDRGRVRVEDMVNGTSPPLQSLYQSAYPRALGTARLGNVELLTEFPVATLAFGYTRGGVGPGESRLVAFRERGTLRAYGSLSKTEALLFQLDPLTVHRYLTDGGFLLEAAASSREARLSILRGAEMPLPLDDHPQPLGAATLMLLHSYSHRLIRTLAAVAGIERDGLAEYLLPHHLSVIVYAAARGDFVLGGLQAVYETALDRVLEDVVAGEIRCPLDPGCRSGGGACMACLHLGEPSCRWFNRFLDRSALFGDHGFLRGDLRG
jgi:hypothetical protein